MDKSMQYFQFQFQPKPIELIRIWIWPAFLGLLWLGAFVAHAADRYVTPPGGYGTNNPPYINWADAATNIQWAVNVATNGDTIWVTNGNYRLTNTIYINTNVTLKSVNGRDVTSLCGNYIPGDLYTNQCIYISNYPPVVIDGFTISNGYANNGPNGDYHARGGAIFAGCRANILNCTIISNYAREWGGGICLWVTGIISNCIIEGNKSVSYGSGGGLSLGNYGLAITTVNCIISGNQGDGILVRTGPVTIRNCVIAYNYSVRNDSGPGVLISGDGAKNTTVENCTIISNYYTIADGYGGGILIKAVTNIQIRNCIIYSNWATYDADWCTNNSTGTVFYNCSTSTTNGMEGSGNITNWPMFVDYSATNFRLAANSPCINTGTNQDWMTNAVDLDGRMRIRYGRVDMGAYERIYNATIYRFR